jgi:DhnA family fructose-bisphosphate aldolase class Ia
MANRPALDELDLSLGKRTRLHRLLYEHGPGNGTLLMLPIEQGMEHGPIDFFPNPAGADPDYQCRLAMEGGYSGIVFHIGLANKYMKAYAGRVPLILKPNGKTNIAPDTDAKWAPISSSSTSPNSETWMTRPCRLPRKIYEEWQELDENSACREAVERVLV